MRTLSDLRNEHPKTNFDARPLPCCDGTIYLMVMPLYYWHRLEVLLMTGDESLDEITGFCLALANRAVTEEGGELDAAFRELLMYYIYRHYQEYKNAQNNLANDNWKNCFTHLK